MSDETAPPPSAPPPTAPPPTAPPPFAPPPGPPPGMAPAPPLSVPIAPVDLVPRFRSGYPVLGASLWIFGALLWAYVVMGEWVLRVGLPEVLGALAVIAAYGLAWLSSVRHLTAPADRWRKLLPGGVGFGLFVATIFAVTLLFGTARQSVAGAITVLLWFFSASVYVAGRYVTARPRVTQTRARVAATVLVRLLVGLTTLVAVASTLSHA